MESDSPRPRHIPELSDAEYEEIDRALADMIAQCDQMLANHPAHQRMNYLRRLLKGRRVPRAQTRSKRSER